MALAELADTFFVSGGTMPEDAPSYVERAADKQLIGALLEGKFCYVLNSRQMGKSSLCVRTKIQLEEKGVRTAFVDLTKIGGRNVTVEQWYAGLLIEVGRALNLRQQLMDYWKENSHLSPMQRFFGGLHDVALSRIQSPIVIFIDEIDSTRSLPFDTDEFFAGIRECFNRRVQEPAYQRLTFCLLGVAVPSDLIRNAQTTPFNIGERIYLRDFTLDEVRSLAKGLPGREQLVDRIHYWTHGHPFLTQSICTAIQADSAIKTEAEVDALISRELFEPKARETNINLADVGNRVLNGYADGEDVGKFRADILSAYQKAISGKTTLQDDESNRVTAVLKLSGLMRSEGKALKVRNPIYERVFGKEWIKENMPGQELRRQRRAFYIGVVRTAIVAAAVIALIANLAFANHRLALEAEAQARENRYQAYVATMDLMPVIYDQRNIARMRQLLAAHKNDPSRNLEWWYWNRMSHEAVAESPPTGLDAYAFSISQDHKQLVVADGSNIDFYSAEDGKLLRTLQENYKETATASFIPNSDHILILMSGGGGLVVDSDGKMVFKVPSDFGTINPAPPFVQNGAFLLGFSPRFGVTKLSTSDGRMTRVNIGTPTSPGNLRGLGYSSATNHIAYPSLDAGYVETFDVAANAPLRKYKLPFNAVQVAYFHGGKHLLVGGSDGEMGVLDLETGQMPSQIKVDEPANLLSISADDSLIAFIVRRRAAGLIDYQNGKLAFRRWYPEANVATLLPDKSRLITLYSNFKFYDPNQPAVAPTYQLGKGPWSGRLRRVDGKDIVTAASQIDGHLVALELNQTNLTPRSDLILDHPIPVLATDPNYFNAIYQIGNTLNVTDFKGKVIFPLQGTGDHASISRGGNYLAVTLDGYKIDIYDFKSGALKTSIKWPSRIAALVFDWQGKYLAVGEEGGSGGMIDSDGWRTLWDHAMHAQGIRSGRFSMDGKLLVTCGDDDCARLWDVKSGRKLQDFYGHAQSVIDADITADMQRVITASDDQTVRVWDIATGDEVTTLGNLPGLPSICQITKDGRYVVTEDSTGQVKFWPITEN